MAWNIILHRLVISEDFKKIDQGNKQLILKAIHKKLSNAPEDYGTPLRGGYKGYWKLRIGDYRVIYRIVRDEIVVVVVKVGIRRDEKIYKELIYRLRKL